MAGVHPGLTRTGLRPHQPRRIRSTELVADQLLAETRRALSVQLRIGEADVDSMIGQVISRANITLSALFHSVPA